MRERQPAQARRVAAAAPGRSRPVCTSQTRTSAGSSPSPAAEASSCAVRVEREVVHGPAVPADHAGGGGLLEVVDVDLVAPRAGPVAARRPGEGAPVAGQGDGVRACPCGRAACTSSRRAGWSHSLTVPSAPAVARAVPSPREGDARRAAGVPPQRRPPRRETRSHTCTSGTTSLPPSAAPRRRRPVPARARRAPGADRADGRGEVVQFDLAAGVPDADLPSSAAADERPARRRRTPGTSPARCGPSGCRAAGPVRASHRRTAWSRPAQATVLPSGLTATPESGLVSSLKVRCTPAGARVDQAERPRAAGRRRS